MASPPTVKDSCHPEHYATQSSQSSAGSPSQLSDEEDRGTSPETSSEEQRLAHSAISDRIVDAGDTQNNFPTSVGNSAPVPTIHTTNNTLPDTPPLTDSNSLPGVFIHGVQNLMSGIIEGIIPGQETTAPSDLNEGNVDTSVTEENTANREDILRADDSAQVAPPPSYDDCIKSAVPLAFIDFWPRCLRFDDDDFLRMRFETFDHVVQEANSWLCAQSRIVLRNCETVEIKVSSLDEYIDMYTATKTRTNRAHYRIPVYVKGLRIWYSSQLLNKLPCGFATTPCRLAYINVRPTFVTESETNRYEQFPTLIEKCNNLSQCGVITGRILSAETVCIKEPDYQGGSIVNKAVDPDQCAWKDTYNKVALSFLRVFYLPDAPVREELHYRDFVPPCLRRSRSNPKFGSFRSVMDDCQLWLLQLRSDYRIINAQTVESKCTNYKETFLDPTVTFHSDYESTPRIRLLRLYYVKPEGAPSLNYLAPLLSYRTFVPKLSGRRRNHETLAMLMRRVEAWLRATGASAVCVETLVVPVYNSKSSSDTDESIFKSEYVNGGTEFDQESLVYTIRLYLDGVYDDPNPEALFEDEEDCAIL